MTNIYQPKVKSDASDAELIAGWAADFGLRQDELGMMTASERQEVLDTFRSLAGWWETPIISDPDNFYAFEDAGYVDAEDDTRKLHKIAAATRLRSFDAGCRPGQVTLDRVISSGDIGAARTALDVAIAKGIPHGGWCRQGRVSEDGRIPDRYCLRETKSKLIRIPLMLNDQDSDSTVVFSLSGEICDSAGMLFFCRGSAIHISREKGSRTDQVNSLRRWLVEHGVRTLNVGGSSSQNEPEIIEFTQFVLAASVVGRGKPEE